MLNFGLQLVTVLVTGILSYLLLHAFIASREVWPAAYPGFNWLLEKSPALNKFLMFVLHGVIAAAPAACTFGQISNHIVISLDILYFRSIKIPILYHFLEKSEAAPAIL